MARIGYPTLCIDLMLAVFMLCAPAAPIAFADDKPIKDVIQLTPRTYEGLSAVKVSTFDTNTGKTRPDAAKLTDIWLRLSAAEGDIAEILARKGEGKPERDRRLFTVEMFAVVNGRLHSDTAGDCTGWNGDVAWCALGCDGQGFRLKRVSADPYRMSIVIAAEARTDDGRSLPPPRPLSLTLCGADDDGHELQVVPVKGREAEIILGRE